MQTLKGSKCAFFQDRGHVVSQNGVETGPEEIEALASWPKVSESMSWFYRILYSRCFIKDYANIVKPLNDRLVGHSTYYTEKLIGKSRECRKRKSQPTPDTKSKSKRTRFNARITNKQ